MRDFRIDLVFPHLNSDYKITSPSTINYNCIAWAAGDSNRWWWPNKFYYWPENLPKKENLEIFIKAFMSLGYNRCPNADLEAGFEKIALFAKEDNVLHAARQLESGKWTSKLGGWYDIEHSKLDGIRGEKYGNVFMIMKRAKK